MTLRSKSKSDTRNAIPSPILSPSMNTIAHSVANGSLAAQIIRPTCRDCGTSKEFNLPDDALPPPSFLCSGCSAGKSMTDGRTAEDVKQTALAKRVHREGRGVNVIPDEPGQSPVARWHKRNPVWRKVYRQLHRAGYRRRPDEQTTPADVVAAWFARVAGFDWQCADCDVAVIEETVHCLRSVSGHPFRLNDCLPLCRSCTKRRAAETRWDREKTRQHAADNPSIHIEGTRQSLSSPAAP
jgi:hypothetical protein